MDNVGQSKYNKMPNGSIEINQSNISDRVMDELIDDNAEDIFNEICMEVEESMPYFENQIVTNNLSSLDDMVFCTSNYQLMSKLIHKDFFNRFEDLFDNDDFN